MSKNKKFGTGKNFNGAPCAYFDGLYQYFNIHAETFHSKAKKWDGPCVKILFNFSQSIFLKNIRLVNKDLQLLLEI